MRRYALIFTSIVLVLAAASWATQAQQAGVDSGNLRFVAELSGDQDDVQELLTLDVTLYGKQVSSQQAEKVLRHFLDAAIILDGTHKIEARVWRSVSSTSTDRQPLTLAGGSNLMSYKPDDKPNPSTAAVGEKAPDGDAESAEDVILSVISGDREVQRSCKDVDAERVATLVEISARNSGTERKLIVKALRTWSRDNDVAVDRGLRSCMSAISKAASAAGGGGGIKVEDLQASIVNGKDAYNIGECGKCHRSGAKGGPRGPDLTDKVWDHCDGTIDGIHKVLLSGVPENKVIDSRRNSAMNPATILIQDEKQVTDLAIYIHSLSQN